MSNYIPRYLYILLFLSFYNIGFSQCVDCTPDLTCIPEIIAPAVCPEVMPDATSGEFYEEVLTFYLPAEFDDIESGQTVALEQVIITNVTGLPFGMDYTLNNEDLTYYPSEGENFGCATICGTPILAGSYNVVITTHVYVTVLGLNLEFDETFVNTLIVLQGEGGNSSFTYDVITGCGSIESNFEALIFTDDQPIDWTWDFGNGNTSIEQFPPTQLFSDAGSFTVTLTTQLWNYELEEINFTDIGGNWYGDIEEPIEAFSNPDPYFVVLDALDNVVFTSEVIDNETNGNWSNLGVVLNNPPYFIQFYDDDNISAHDLLATFNLEVNQGIQNFNSDGTVGSMNVDLVVSDTFYDEQEINVFSLPEFDFVTDEDLNTIVIEGDSTLTGFQWTINGEIQDEVSNEIDLDEGGVYSCLVSNSFGCVMQSEEYVHCPEFTPEFDDDNNLLIAPDNFETYQWLFNGLPIDGEINNTFSTSDPGNYAVEITTSYGCTVQSEWFVLVGIDEFENDNNNNLLIYPNPTRGNVNIEMDYPINDVHIYNEIGVLIENINVESKNIAIDLSKYSNGVYYINVSSLGRTIVRKVVKN